MKIRQFALISIWVIFLVACDATESYYENEGNENENEPYASQEEQPSDIQEEIEPDQDITSVSASMSTVSSPVLVIFIYDIPL